ncbi:MAG: amidase [Dehalococcoidia bacterium]
MSKLYYLSAAKLARSIRTKEVSSREVVEAHLRRIEEVNPKLNAVVQFTADSALDEAQKADEALASGNDLGPLHGVPVTFKDAFETAGVVSTGGIKGREGFVPTEDATVVARLRNAGAILLGKTNLPELGMAWETDNLVYGRTNNPYDLDRTPGGSTGGEAAIIAAGGSSLGFGADSGGSIRQPAHFCGIAGIKPSAGLVPRTGHFQPAGGPLDSFFQVGPMARFVEDLILTLPLVAGPDGRDFPTAPVPLGNPARVDVGRLSVAYHTDNGIMSPTTETANAIRKAAEALADSGATVTEARPQEIEKSFELYETLSRAADGADCRRLLEETGTTQVSPLLQQWFDLLPGKVISLEEFEAAFVQWDEFRIKMLSFMDDHDVILCPTAAYPAMHHGTTFDSANLAAFSYTETYNLTGWPGVVVRAGTSPEGLPIGVQVVAGPWRDEVALAVAQRIETLCGGWQPPPL